MGIRGKKFGIVFLVSLTLAASVTAEPPLKTESKKSCARVIARRTFLAGVAGTALTVFYRGIYLPRQFDEEINKLHRTRLHTLQSGVDEFPKLRFGVHPKSTPQSSLPPMKLFPETHEGCSDCLAKREELFAKDTDSEIRLLHEMGAMGTSVWLEHPEFNAIGFFVGFHASLEAPGFRFTPEYSLRVFGHVVSRVRKTGILKHVDTNSLSPTQQVWLKQIKTSTEEDAKTLIKSLEEHSEDSEFRGFVRALALASLKRLQGIRAPYIPANLPNDMALIRSNQGYTTKQAAYLRYTYCYKFRDALMAQRVLLVIEEELRKNKQRPLHIGMGAFHTMGIFFAVKRKLEKAGYHNHPIRVDPHFDEKHDFSAVTESIREIRIASSSD